MMVVLAGDTPTEEWEGDTVNRLLAWHAATPRAQYTKHVTTIIIAYGTDSPWPGQEIHSIYIQNTERRLFMRSISG